MSFKEFKEKNKGTAQTGGFSAYKTKQPKSDIDLRDPLGTYTRVGAATASMRAKEMEKTSAQRLSEQLRGRETVISAPPTTLSGKMQNLSLKEKLAQLVPESVRESYGRATGDIISTPESRKITGFATEMGQGFSRDLAALLSAGQTITPSNPIQRAIYGDKPFNLETVGREYADIVGKGEDVGRRTAMGIGVFAGLLSLPARGLGLIKESSKVISKLDDVTKIKNELKRLGIEGTQKEVDALANVLKAEKDAKVVEDILQGIGKEQKAQRTAQISDIELPDLPKTRQLKVRELKPTTPGARSLLETAEKEGKLLPETQARDLTPQKLDERRLQLVLTKDALDNSPLKSYEKYVARSGEFKGRLPEDTSELKRLGIETTEDLRREMDDYLMRKEMYRQQRQELLDDVKTAKLERKAIREFERKLKPVEKTNERIRKAVEKERARTTKRVKTETKKVEQKAAKRQVDFEKREAKRQVAKAREELLTKMRAVGDDVKGIKDELIAYTKTRLAPKDRGKALTFIRDAKTQRNLTRAMARIERWADEAEKRTLRNDILKMQKRIMDSPTVALEYKGKLKELMKDFELKGKRKDKLEQLRKTREFLTKQEQAGEIVDIPRKVVEALETLNRTPFKELTVGHLRGVMAKMEVIESLGRRKIKVREELKTLQKERILSEINANDAPPVQELEEIRPKIGERLTATQKMKNFIWSQVNRAGRLDRALTPMDAIFDLLDGGKGLYTGPNYRHFKATLDADWSRYIQRRNDLQAPVVDFITKHKLDGKNFDRIGVVAAREQDGGLEKLVASGYTEKEIAEVVLNKEEKQLLDMMRETFDSQFPEIQNTMRRVYNKDVEKVKNYFSFLTDWEAMNESEVFMRFGSNPLDDAGNPASYGAAKKNVEQGFTISRVGGAQKIKINAFEVFLNHTDNTSYLLELGEDVKNLSEIARSPQYAKSVGDSGQLMVSEWLDTMARKGGAAGVQDMKIVDTLRRNVGAGILGLKLSTVAIQPTALFDGAGFVGAGYVAKGTKMFATDAEWRRFIAEMPEIKDRMGGEFALRELSADNWWQEVQRKGFVPMQYMDKLTAGSVASGAYIRKMKELGRAIDMTKGYDPEALEYAQLAVRRTQSSGAFKDVPLAISRGDSLLGNRSVNKALLQFNTFLLTRWSRLRHDAIRASIRTKDPRQALGPVLAITAASMFGAGVRLGVNRVEDFIAGKETEDEIDDELMANFMYEMSGSIPFMGTINSMVVYDGEMMPVLDAPYGLVKGLYQAVNAESESAKLRGITEFSGSVGKMFGVPGSTQAESIARGFIPSSRNKKSSDDLGLDLDLDLDLGLDELDLDLDLGDLEI